MSDILFSIIIPTYNSAKFIKRAVDSILIQEFDSNEILIIDDGSTDNTKEVVDDMVKGANCITYIYQENQGPGMARNLGIKCAQGKYLLFLDVDDTFEIDTLKCLNEHIKSNQFDLTCFGYKLYGQNKKLLSGLNYDSPPMITDHILDLFEHGTIKNVIWNKLYYKAFLLEKKIQFEDLKINEDALFIYEILLNTKNIGFLNRALYNHISDNKSSFTNQFSASHFDSTIILLNKIKHRTTYEFDSLYDNAFKTYCLRVLSYLIFLSALSIKEKPKYKFCSNKIYESNIFKDLNKFNPLNIKFKLMLFFLKKPWLIWNLSLIFKKFNYTIQ